VVLVFGALMRDYLRARHEIASVLIHHKLDVCVTEENAISRLGAYGRQGNCAVPEVSRPEMQIRSPFSPSCTKPMDLESAELDGTYTNLRHMMFVCCNCGRMSDQHVARRNTRAMDELAAAEHAKMVIDTLVVTSPNSPNTLETLRRLYDQARKANWQAFSSDDEVNAAARNKALLALNDIIGSLQARWLTPAKINKGKTAFDPWIQLLKAAQPSAGQDGGNRMTNTEEMVNDDGGCGHSGIARQEQQ
jgi:hypothetical protein